VLIVRLPEKSGVFFDRGMELQSGLGLGYECTIDKMTDLPGFYGGESGELPITALDRGTSEAGHYSGIPMIS